MARRPTRMPLTTSKPNSIQIALPPKLLPVFSGQADVRGAYGGRGSGKTRSFAMMSAIRAYQWAGGGAEGLILCGRRFMNSLADSTIEEIKAAITSHDWLAPFFEIGETYIRTSAGLPGRIDYSFLGLERHSDSIKSTARLKLAWIDEAEAVSEAAWASLVPTLREDGSELWVTWNPERENSATHRRFRLTEDRRSKIAELNWQDNPWFPARCGATTRQLSPCLGWRLSQSERCAGVEGALCPGRIYAGTGLEWSVFWRRLGLCGRSHDTGQMLGEWTAAVYRGRGLWA
jgi:phage terminase large subunit